MLGIKHPVQTSKLYIELVHYIQAFSITGGWKASALKDEVWIETVAEGERRFMAAWRNEGVDAARHRQEKEEATRLGKL